MASCSAAHADEVDAAGDAPVLERWQVEWNVARSLQARGDTETALQRVQRLLEPSSIHRFGSTGFTVALAGRASADEFGLDRWLTQFGGCFAFAH